MRRRDALVMVGALVVAGACGAASAAEVRPFHTQRVKDLVITLASETGGWTQGRNAFVLEFTSAKDSAPLDAGKVSLSTSMPMPGMAPMLAGATLTPDGAPGRYRGTVAFPDRGARQVTVSWDGPAGKGTTRFSVPVR